MNPAPPVTSTRSALLTSPPFAGLFIQPPELRGIRIEPETVLELSHHFLPGDGQIRFQVSPRIGEHVHVYNSANIYFPWNLEVGEWSAIGEHALIYNLGTVRIGSKVTISQRAHLCAGSHDHTDPSMPLLKPPIVIEDQAWVCADAYVGPGVIIGEGAVVGARSVVTKNVEPWHIVVGNPARFLRKRELQHRD